MPQTQQYCTFMLDGLLFGVEVERVQEILRYQEVTPVPLAPNVIRGLIDLRGQIVTAIDLRRRLELNERPEDEVPMIVVLRTEEGGISLLVDRIAGILEVGDDRFERPPETVHGVAKELIRGAYKLENKLLLVLEVNKAIDVDVADSGAMLML